MLYITLFSGTRTEAPISMGAFVYLLRDTQVQCYPHLLFFLRRTQDHPQVRAVLWKLIERTLLKCYLFVPSVAVSASQVKRHYYIASPAKWMQETVLVVKSSSLTKRASENDDRRIIPTA